MIRVFGQITDASGKGVPGAMIELRALKSTAEVLYGSVLPYKCDALGNYDFPLAIGAYDAYAQNDACGDMGYLGSAVVAANTTDGDLHHILVDGGINIIPPMLESAMEYTRRAEQAAVAAETDREQTGKDVAATTQNRQVSETKAREAAESAGEAKSARDSIVNDAADVRLKAKQVADNTVSVANNTATVQRNTDQVAQNTQTVSVKTQQVSENTQSVAANTLSVTQMRDEVVAKTSMAQGAADTATQKAASAAGHDASSAANAKIAQDAASAVQGVLIDGGECDLSSGAYPLPQTVAGKNYSTVWYVKTGGTVSGLAYDVGDVLRYTTAKGGYYFRVDAVDTATTQINAHAAKDGAHPISGVAGLAEALADKLSAGDVSSAVGDSIAPLPDVWIPFNDSLRMITGFGDYDRVYIGEQYLELNSRSASFERATTATYIDKSGVLRTAAINEPRFEKQGLLIEGQSTNQFSNSMLDANVSASRATIAAKSAASPDGANNAAIVSETTDTGVHWFGASATSITAGAAVTASIFVKKGTRRYFGIRILDQAGTSRDGIEAILDLDTGALTGGSIGTATFISKSVQRLSDGWFRVSVSGIRAQEVEARAFFYLLGSDSFASYTGSPSENVLAFGVQVEELPFASSYIPTNGTAVTRAADKCWLSCRNTPRWGEITCAIQMHTSDTAITEAIDNSSAARTVMAIVDRPDGVLYLRNRPSGYYHVEYGSNWKNTSVKATYATDNIMAFRIHGGTEQTRTRDLFVNSVKASSAEAYTFNAGAEPAEAMFFGQTATGRHLFGHIRNLRIWLHALSDAQIKGLA